MIKVALLALLLTLLQTLSVNSTRLSRDVVPSNQLLHLKFDLEKWRYEGRTEILFEVKKRRNTIWLYASTKHYRIVGINLIDQTGKTRKIARAISDRKKKILLIRPQSHVEPGQYKIVARFHGKIREALQGMIKTGYVDSRGHKHKQVTTHFEPDKAREAFPCFDEPSFRVRIKLIVEHPASHNTNSAGPVKSRKRIGENRVRTEFEETESMSVYLLAINVHDMGKVSVKSGRGIPVTVLTPDYAKKEALRTAKLAARSLDFYEKYLGVNYPFKKLDIIGIFDFNAGGMENIGMIHLMYDCAYSGSFALSPRNELYCRSVIVHEVSHMWFGNMVSLKWWEDLWLKEGFARFITSYAQDHGVITDRRPGDHELQLIMRGYYAGINDDKFRFTKPVRQKLKDSYGAAAMFNNLSYAKGSWILRAVLKLIGEANFQKGLQKYFKTYRLKSADFNDFTGCFDKITSTVSVRDFMENWLNEPGFPMVKIAKDKHKEISLTQSRYTPKGNYKTNQVWLIPVNFKSNAEPSTKYKLWGAKRGRHIFSKPFKWYVHDTYGAEFAIYLYDENNMRALSKELQRNPKVLSDVQRTVYTLNLIENYDNGRVSTSTFLDTSRYVYRETQGDIIERWTLALLHFKNKLFLAENRHNFERYFKHVLIAHIEHSMKKEIQETKDWNVKKYYKWMFYFGVRWRVPAARARAKRVIRQFLSGKHVNIVYLSFVLRVYRRIRRSWRRIFHLLKWYPRSIHEYQIILSYVCHTEDPKQQLYILNFSITSQIMPRAIKRKTVCYVASRNPELTWRFFKRNYGYYFSMYGESQFSFDALLACVTENLETRRDYEDVKRFFRNHSSGTGSAGLKRGLESIRKNMAATKRESSSQRKTDYDEIFRKFIKTLNTGELSG